MLNELLTKIQQAKTERDLFELRAEALKFRATSDDKPAIERLYNAIASKSRRLVNTKSLTLRTV